MQRSTLSGMIVGLVLLCSGRLFASEADELRERARAMQKAASMMAERGTTEQAERLEKESLKLLEAAEQMELQQKKSGGEPDINREARHLQDRLQDLLAKEKRLLEEQASEEELADVREHIAATKRELQAIHADRAGPGKLPPESHAQAEKLEAAARRIYHLRAAAHNLKLAEAHDLAHQVMQQAEAMERDVHAAKKRLAAALPRTQDHEYGPDVVRKLKEEIERLQAEVRELRQQAQAR